MKLAAGMLTALAIFAHYSAFFIMMFRDDPRADEKIPAFGRLIVGGWGYGSVAYLAFLLGAFVLHYVLRNMPWSTIMAAGAVIVLCYAGANWYYLLKPLMAGRT